MRLAEPADDGALLDRMRGGADVDEAAVAYIPPLLASLSAQLVAERRRRTDAEQQVALLAAQVARREAELEARLEPTPSRKEAEKERITREHALDVLERTLARNRALEADVRLLDAKVKAARVYHHAERDGPPPRSSSLASSPRRPDRVRSAPPPPLPISPARSIRDVVVLPRPTFGHRQARKQQRSPSPVPRSSSSSRAPSPIPPPRTPSPACVQTPPPRARTAPPPPPPAVRALDAHLNILEDTLAAQHRERDRLARLSAQTPPFDPDQFTRTGLLEAECVRLMRRVRELELQLALKDAGGGDAQDVEDPDTTVRAPMAGSSRPGPPPAATLLPPIDLGPLPAPASMRPSSAPLPPLVPFDDVYARPNVSPQRHASQVIHPDPAPAVEPLPGGWPPRDFGHDALSPDAYNAHQHGGHDAHPHADRDTRASDAHAAHADGSAEQRMAALAAELARAQDAVEERERAMEELRQEIARLRGAHAG